MLAEDHGMKFEWDGTICEIVVSDDLGYVLDVRPWCCGRFVYMIDKLNRATDHEDDDVTIAQWHAATEEAAKRDAEAAYLRHLSGGPIVVQ